MFSKHITSLEYKDVEDLVFTRKEKEGYHLDYKKGIGNPDKAKNELSKDISSFANSGGGYLIIGVDDHLSIVGIDKEVNNKPVAEWINQIASSNIEPTLFYFDPKVIAIPDTDKVIVIIYVPESSKKPHIVTGLYNYFIRINDSSKKANHIQIRDMFDVSRNRTAAFQEFLKKRGLNDEDDEEFGLNSNSKHLYSEVPEKVKKEKPLVLFSLIPKFPENEKLNLPFSEFKTWLEQNSKGHNPLGTISLYYCHDYDLRLDGVVLKYYRGNFLNSYFEILNNGFVEAGFSSTVTYPFEQEEKTGIAIYLTPIIVYEMLLLEWSKKFFEMIKYFDEVLLQISFVNVLDLQLYGLHQQYDRVWRFSYPSNTQHENFRLNYSFNINSLSSQEVLNIAKHHSEKICRAFGLEKDYCFVDDKISPNSVRSLI